MPNSSTIKEGQAPSEVPTVRDLLQKMVCDCDEEVPDNAVPPGKDYCKDLGDEKHKCVHRKIEQHIRDGNNPPVTNETGWDDYYDEINEVTVFEPVPYPRSSYMRTSGSKWPDAASMNLETGTPEQCYDFKFKCPTSTYKGPPKWGRGQRAKYASLTRRWVGAERAKELPPVKLSNTDC